MYIRKVLFTNKLALILILCYTIVKTVMLPERLQHDLSPTHAQAVSRTYAAKTITLPDLSDEDYSQIVERNPFNPPGFSDTQKRSSTDTSDSDPSVSEELGLALFGTISGNPSIARAIIKNIETGIINLYKTGQQIDNARVERIGRDIVTLSYDGKTKTLMLSSRRLAADVDNENIRWPQAADGLEENLLNQQEHINIRTKLRYVELILKKATIKPYVVNDITEGLRITGLENIKLAAALGLKNGDVIRSINGQQLTSKKKAYQVFIKARTQPVIDLELLRDDEIKTLSFIIR